MSIAVGQVVGGVELVAPGGLGALDAGLEIGSLGRQDDEFDALVAAMALEDGHEFGPAVDLDASELEGRAGDELAEQAPCGAAGYGVGDVFDGPLGDRIVGAVTLTVIHCPQPERRLCPA